MKNPMMLALIAFLILALAGLYVSCNKKASLANSEKFYELDAPTGYQQPPSVAMNTPTSPDTAATGFGAISASDPSGNEIYNPVGDGAAGAEGPTCFPRDRLTAEELLPKDAADSKWAKMNPAGQGDVKDQNFLTAGYHIGIITNTTRNANLQLRSEPPNPTMPVSVFNIPTIQPDTLRKPLEIGAY